MIKVQVVCLQRGDIFLLNYKLLMNMNFFSLDKQEDEDYIDREEEFPTLLMRFKF